MNVRFIMGILTALCVMMMIQDLYGLEGYINHLRNSWVEIPWWVSGVFAALFTWLGHDES